MKTQTEMRAANEMAAAIHIGTNQLPYPQSRCRGPECGADVFRSNSGEKLPRLCDICLVDEIRAHGAKEEEESK